MRLTGPSTLVLATFTPFFCALSYRVPGFGVQALNPKTLTVWNPELAIAGFSGRQASSWLSRLHGPCELKLFVGRLTLSPSGAGARFLKLWKDILPFALQT